MASFSARSRWLKLVCAAATFGSAADAQVDEADRRRRCENNREAVARAENDLVLSGYLSDEAISRARTALLALRRDRQELFLIDTELFNQMTSPHRRQELVGRMDRVGLRMAENMRSIGMGCGLARDRSEYALCLRDSPHVIAGMIDTAERARARAPALLRRVEASRANLAALRCDQAPAPGVADISDNWRALDGSTYAITMNGNAFSWTRSGTDETANGTISGDSLSAQWRSSQGSGGGGASIVRAGNGVPVQIRWSNGNVFSR